MFHVYLTKDGVCKYYDAANHHPSYKLLSMYDCLNKKPFWQTNISSH